MCIIYIYIYINLSLSLYIYIYIFVYLSLSLSIYIYIYIYIQTCKHIRSPAITIKSEAMRMPGSHAAGQKYAVPATVSIYMRSFLFSLRYVKTS